MHNCFVTRRQLVASHKTRDGQVLLICPELTFHLTRAPHLKHRSEKQCLSSSMATCHPPSNLVACDLSGGFEFVSVGLWDLSLQIAGSLGPRLRRRRRKRRCARKGSLKLQPEGIGHWKFPPVSSLCMEDAISSPKHAATSSLSELANQGSRASQPPNPVGCEATLAMS